MLLVITSNLVMIRNEEDCFLNPRIVGFGHITGETVGGQ